MSAPPSVLLSPRPAVRLPTQPIEIPPPPLAPAPPSGSLLYQILPVLLAGGGMAIILVVGSAQGLGGSLAVLLLGSLLLVGGGAVVSVLVHRSQTAAYRRRTRQRLQRYSQLLVSTRDRLQHLLDEQQRLLLDKDPDPRTCLRLVCERAARLWERSPEDADFLLVRAGLGAQRSSVEVRAPRQPDPLAPDPLIEAAHALSAWASQVWGVPVGVSLADGQCIGACGERSALVATVRALVLQLAAHHAPDEVKLAVVFAESEAQEWAWLRWLPHVWSQDQRQRYLATNPEEAAALSRRLEEVLGRRAERSTSPASVGPSTTPRLPVYVILVADADLADTMPVLAQLQARDVRFGASCLFLAPDRQHLPRGCRSILEIDADGSGRLTDPEAEVQEIPVLDAASVELLEQLAAALAPLRARRIAAASTLPAQAPLLELLGVEAVEDLAIHQRWARAVPDRSLAVPIGIRPGGETLWLDLHQSADGPHGLIAGSTGSGKSALLQSLLLALSATFHPHDVGFVLVDYKGGSTAGPLRELPHLIGTITNLDGNLARRALVAIQAEIERRQARLSDAGCDDLDTYLARRRRGEPLEPLPHLVLVVDEFAELKAERPDFIHQLVRTARVGRNVGLHLILATQKPRPAVDDEIWANARFRICLRVEQPQDSQDVLKRPDAAALSARGQGYLQVGHDEVFTLFQGAFAGAVYRPDAGVRDPHAVVKVELNGARRALGADEAAGPNGRERSQADALVSSLRGAAAEASIERLGSIWLPPLGDRVVLRDVLGERTGWHGNRWRPTPHWMAPVVGQVDDPARRTQLPLRLDLPRAGNLLVYGAPGAGKTTALLTLAASLATEHSPADLQLYVLDFGGQAFGSLAKLPHVGGVVLGDEQEKLVRLLRQLLGELARRKAAFGAAGVATLPAYRSSTGDGLPAVVLILDNLPALVHAYPDLEDDFAQIAQQGGTLGIHLAASATSPTLVRLRIASSFGQAVALRLADRADYGAILSVPDGYEPASQPGRGLVKGRPALECQIALPAAGATEAEQTAGLRRLAHAMDGAWHGPRPWLVRTLPERVRLEDLLTGARSDGAPIAPVGLSVDDLEPLQVDLRDGPHFLIVGPPRGGKSTLLRSWLVGLSATLPASQLEIVLCDVKDDHPALPDGASPRRVETSCLSEVLDGWERSGEAGNRRVLAIDDLDTLLREADSLLLERLTRLIQGRYAGVHLLVVATTGCLSASYDGLGRALKQAQTGFLLGGSDYEDLQALGLNVPHAEASQGLAPGRGYYARHKRYVRVKIAEPPAVPN